MLRLWFAVQTQWRVGVGGPTGLDYPGVESVMRLSFERSPKDRAGRAELFVGLQVMERATLGEWARQAERERSRSK